MGKTKNRAAQAAAAGQTRAAPGSPEAARAAAHLTPRPHIERHLLATLAQDKRANAARALTSLRRRYPAGPALTAALHTRLEREPPHSPLARQIRTCLHTLANGRQTPP